MKRNRIETYVLSLADLERTLIKEYNYPKDIIITNFTRAANQRAIVVELSSREFPLSNDLDTYPTARKPEGWKYVNN